MNRLFITGNLVRDPELRTTPQGASVCSFTVAVNRRGKDQGTDYFNISAWRELGENCVKYLAKGRKVAVIGSVSVRTYQKNDGSYGASMEVHANDVEFLSSRSEDQKPEQRQEQKPKQQTFTDVTKSVDEELPF